jgi:hypothetical protein
LPVTRVKKCVHVLLLMNCKGLNPLLVIISKFCEKLHSSPGRNAEPGSGIPSMQKRYLKYENSCLRVTRCYFLQQSQGRLANLAGRDAIVLGLPK